MIVMFQDSQEKPHSILNGKVHPFRVNQGWQ